MRSTVVYSLELLPAYQAAFQNRLSAKTITPFFRISFFLFVILPDIILNNMKSKIALSRLSTILTTILILAFFIGCVVTVHDKPTFFSLLFIYIILIVCALIYGASYIKTDSDHIILGSILRKRKILISDIESVELFQPTMGAIRIFASGGFMGYWGIFREGDIGRYYAFYGKASDSFLIRMKNGDKYVLGCENPSAMIDYINSQINK